MAFWGFCTRGRRCGNRAHVIFQRGLFYGRGYRGCNRVAECLVQLRLLATCRIGVEAATEPLGCQDCKIVNIDSAVAVDVAR